MLIKLNQLRRGEEKSSFFLHSFEEEAFSDSSKPTTEMHTYQDSHQMEKCDIAEEQSTREREEPFPSSTSLGIRDPTNFAAPSSAMERCKSRSEKPNAGRWVFDAERGWRWEGLLSLTGRLLQMDEGRS
ncbi:hypothetical protein Dimus_022400 [Dionaea muscipula]